MFSFFSLISKQDNFMTFENSRYLRESVFHKTCTIPYSRKQTHTKCEYAKNNFLKTRFLWLK